MGSEKYAPFRIKKAESWDARVVDHDVVMTPVEACSGVRLIPHHRAQ